MITLLQIKAKELEDFSKTKLAGFFSPNSDPSDPFTHN
jgi:hypothetical protein